MTLQEIAQQIFEKASGYDMRKISLVTAANLHRLANGDGDDFVIFDNAGGMPFTVWSGDTVEALAGDEGLAKAHIYAYRVAGRDFILKTPIFDTAQRWIHWQGNMERLA